MSLFTHALYDYFQRGNPFAEAATWRRASRRSYRAMPSFSDLLPWLDVASNGSVLLDDMNSQAMVLELYPKSVEGKTTEFLKDLQDALANVLAHSFIGDESCPWILQCYSFRDNSALQFDWRNAIARFDTANEHKNLSAMRAVFHEHIERCAQSEGIFVDKLTSKNWQGARQRVIVCFYRSIHNGSDIIDERNVLEQQTARFRQQLVAAGIDSRCLSDMEVFCWLARWFDPDAVPNSSFNLAQQRCRFDYSLSDAVSPRSVESHRNSGIWRFNNRYSRLLSLQRLQAVPVAGQLSAEYTAGERMLCLAEQLPPQSVVNLTFVFTGDDAIHSQLDRIAHVTTGRGVHSDMSRNAVDLARRHLLSGEKVYPFFLGVFIYGKNAKEIRSRAETVDALFASSHLQCIAFDEDPAALDSYLRHLPMAYRYHLDQIQYRNRLIFSKDAAALLPLYGRARGSGKLGLSFFNRGGELFSYNPLDIEDRAKNAHLFLFGPTGAGKSATLVYLQMLLMSFHRPRIIAIEAGNSFGLLADYFKKNGLAVRDIAIKPGCGCRLAPFANAKRLLLDRVAVNNIDGRDVLSEMSLLARLMITGGKAEEEKSFSRVDESLLRSAILRAAEVAAATSNGEMAVTDLANALLAMKATVSTHQQRRIMDMAQTLSLFCDGFAGELFNSGGGDWQVDDYLRLDMGVLASGQYRDLLSVAWLSLMNAVIGFAEKHQRDGRPIILLTDEAHIITGNPLLASYVVKISKLLGRRLGLWLWMATQNMDDFQGESKKMLSMFEWWLALGVRGDDIERLSQFIPLGDNERSMLSSVRKQSGGYTEGVLLTDSIKERFRHVPPALCLALAQTEKEEKTQREVLMKKHGCDELEAVMMIAQEMLKKTTGSTVDTPSVL